MCFLKKNISTYLTQYANNNSKKIIDLKENIIDKDFLGRTHTHTPHKKKFSLYLKKMKEKEKIPAL